MPTNSKTAIVWSKNSCIACGSAKMMLGQRGYLIEERNIDGPQWSREDLLAKFPNARMVPVIEIGDDFVGNLKTLGEYLDRVKDTTVE